MSGRLRRVLLGVLLARGNEVVSTHVLRDALWGGETVERAGQRLQLHVHRLRGLLDEPDRLALVPGGYRLRVEEGEVDADRFATLTDAGRALVAHDPERAVETLGEALALWRGTPFSDIDVPLLDDWTQRLAEQRLTAHEALHEAHLACGQHTAAISELTPLVREHPLRERFHVLLMAALHQAGRRSDALAAYHTARKHLLTELNAEPGPELRDLEHRVLTGDPAPLPPPFPPPPPTRPRPDHTPTTPRHRPDAPPPAQLPAETGGFVGRADELDQLRQLATHRDTTPGSSAVVAVTGTAGVGKTALVVRCAHQIKEAFPDGQLYVDLRGYGPDHPVPPEDALAGFLRALGLEGGPLPQDVAERAARFRSLTAQRRMLLVLDNARGVEQIRPLLPGNANCLTIVTSRDSLAGLVAREGAHRLSLDRLPLDDARLLMDEMLGERAHSEPHATDTLIKRCARLPLALRITAEVARSRPTRHIAGLVTELTDQQETLDLLDIDGDPHTAVRAVFSWSYEQLTPDAARAFRLLGLHPSHDTDLHAVAALADAALRETRHVLRELLQAHLTDSTTHHRYRLHDLLRAYAAELATTLDSRPERQAALTRLRHYYLATASAAMDTIAPFESSKRPKVSEWTHHAPHLTTPHEALHWLDAERGNLVESTRDGDPAHTIAMSETIRRYLDVGGYHDEAITLHTRALHAARTTHDAAAEAHVRRYLAMAMDRAGRTLQAAVDHLQRALDTYQRLGLPAGQSAALINLGNVHTSRGHHHQAIRYYEQGLRLGVDDWALRRAALINLGQVQRFLGHHQLSLGHLEEGLSLCREHGDRINEANALCHLAETHTLLGHDQQAMNHVRPALTLARATGSRLIESQCLRILGLLHQRQGDIELALRHHGEAAGIARSVDNRGILVTVLNDLAATQAAAGHPDEALHSYEEAMTAAVEGRHQEKQARTHTGIAELHHHLGDHSTAHHHWRQALHCYETLGLPQATRIRTRLTDHPDPTP
ncbi:AfsR/SARP family transcriptional regulator [Streptomyces profundus]|uniref:AfsR/SARP family transcriptional regulator n=1 Tax=Streptomyces profundus TaxID=2867410 RepID=UPI001D160054|nr:BTAD domain-containing putative transcriptional regulator [Streptomyces sp. MA3_2.13]UED88163.1 tetratricopeptide repeat protein [Streptomyces sp. MA3_2.13]